MLKVVSIDQIEPYVLTCSFNNGSRRKLDVLPLIQKHNHLNGASELLNEAQFKKAQIGEMGEVFWKGIIRNSANETWDYDISPEFIFWEGKEVEK